MSTTHTSTHTQVRRHTRRARMIAAALLVIFCALTGSAGAAVFWETRNISSTMDTDLQENVTFDGTKSIIRVPGDGKQHAFIRWTRFANFELDEFVLELGATSPWIRWEIVAGSQGKSDELRVLASGKGGGGRTHKAALAALGLPSWTPGLDVGVRVSSDKDGTIEIRRWAIETPEPNLGRFTAEFDRIARELAHASPLERGITRHWHPEIGGFVCTFNSTHPEHYNYWLEDEGEQLWSFGNYPEMMRLYGKGLRDFIVKHCRQGFPLRKANNQPLIAEPRANGEFWMDTGILVVDGHLAEDPQVDLHHSAYQTEGLLARIGSFFVSYKNTGGELRTIELGKPTTCGVDYHKPQHDYATLAIEGSSAELDIRFDVVVYRGRVSVNADVTNKSGQPLTDVVAGFSLRDCRSYFKNPLNSVKRFGDVVILYSEQPMLENCNIVRVAGPAARAIKTQESDGKIETATASARVAQALAPGEGASMSLAKVNAGSTSFAAKIERYKDIDFDDADISMSYVGTYALLGLATYSYRYPEDTEAREVVDLMIENWLAARERARNRELAYLLWVLDLLGRKDDAEVVADLIEKRVIGQTFHSMDNSGMALALRRAGRWDAADRLCATAMQPWTGGVAAPTDVLGFGALQSPKCLETCLTQLSHALTAMSWNMPDKLTAPGAQEAGCYMLVVYDLLSRLHGGIVPIRMGPREKAWLTGLAYDQRTGEWQAGLNGADTIEVYTHFRPPSKIEWNGAALDQTKWRYDHAWGLVRVNGLSGEGKLIIAVDGAAPKDDPAWLPIDYIGLNSRRK